MWADSTVDYISNIGAAGDIDRRRPLCGYIQGQTSSRIDFEKCGVSLGRSTRLGDISSDYLCQLPDTDRSQLTQPPPSSVRPPIHSSLAKVNVTTISQDGGQWRPVVCPNGHVTHVFLVCDISTFCWAKGNVTFSFLSSSWALPSSQSCRAQLSSTSLPPSFPCRNDKQRVPYSLVCDHRPDCVDSSDEVFCTFFPCPPSSYFQCLNKQVCTFLPLFLTKTMLLLHSSVTTVIYFGRPFYPPTLIFLTIIEHAFWDQGQV